MRLHSAISSLYMMRITIRATTLFCHASIIQDFKQKLYSHTVCVSPEPILFMMFNMKSISVAFPQHTHYDNICIVNAFYKVVNEELGHANVFTLVWDLYFEVNNSKWQ